MSFTFSLRSKLHIDTNLSSLFMKAQGTSQDSASSTHLQFYIPYILSSVLLGTGTLWFCKLVLLAVATYISLYLLKKQYFDLAICFQITILFFINYLESLQHPEISNCGVLLLAGIGLLCSKNLLVHAYNVFICLLANFVLTQKLSSSYGLFDDQIQTLQKVSSLRLLQAVMFFYILRKLQSDLSQKSQSLIQTNQSISRQLEDVKSFKTAFLSCFSHEVRNPLHVLHGAIDMLLKNIREQSLNKFLQEAKLSADILLKLVNNILDASSLQINKFELNYGYNNLRSILTQLININLELINQKKLRLRVYVDKEIPEEIYTDASRLLLVLSNLLSNAIKFSDEGQLIYIYLSWHHQNTDKSELLEISKDNVFAKRLCPKSGTFSPSLSLSPTFPASPSLKKEIRFDERGLTDREPSEVLETSSAEWAHRKFINTCRLDFPRKTVSIREINSSHEQLRNKYVVIDTNIAGSLHNIEKLNTTKLTRPGFLKIEISDQGCGIEKEHQSNIFELFAKLDSSMTRKYGGIGIGLWVSKQIIEKSGGQIKVHSEEALGTTFVFYLPVHLPEESFVHSKSLPEPLKNKKPKLTALVVDDYKFNRDILQKILEEEGVEVYTAENGQEAVHAYKSQSKDFYDLLITDLQMPIMDGVTSSKKIRAIQREEGRKEIDIYIVSANCAENDVRECMDPQRGIGAKEFFNKPVDNAKLRSLIKRKLNRQLSTY